MNVSVTEVFLVYLKGLWEKHSHFSHLSRPGRRGVVVWEDHKAASGGLLENKFTIISNITQFTSSKKSSLTSLGSARQGGGYLFLYVLTISRA